MENWMKLEEIFDVEQWEKLQDALVRVSKMAIIMVNYKGEPVTKHSGCQEFCQLVRQESKLKNYCQKCDARGGFEAMNNKEPYIYKCYFSIIDIAIPIVVNKRYIGAIMAGQVRLPEMEKKELETILYPVNQDLIEEKREEYLEQYNKLPVLSYERIKVIADLMYYLCNYMCAETAKKLEVLGMYETVFNNQADSPDSLSGDREEKWIIDAGVMGAGTTEAIKVYMGGGFDDYHEIIKNVFHYIFTHREERPSLKDMAEYCHVSMGYLSHLFTKEVGENYSSFIPKIKVEWAKAMLESTDISITAISDQLGFSETGYFIKTFKKHVGVTPLVYKKYCKSK